MFRLVSRTGVALFLICLPATALAHFGAKLEPPDGRVLHGAQGELSSVVIWQRRGPNGSSIADYQNAAGAQPLLITQYVSLWEPLQKVTAKIDAVETTVSRGRIPVLGMSFHAPLIAGGKEIPAKRDLTRDIAGGKMDKVIAGIGRRLAAMPGPVFVRPGYEFGGGGDGKIYDEKAYPDAFRRIVKIIRGEGATNVAFIWHHLNAPDPMNWYPGDAYVDWWGISIFQYPRQSVRDFAAEAARHSKPLILSEASPRDSGSVGPDAWKNWYGPFFNFIHATPNVKAFCYLNNTWRGQESWKDSRIELDPKTTALYRKEMEDPIYIHASAAALPGLDKALPEKVGDGQGAGEEAQDASGEARSPADEALPSGRPAKRTSQPVVLPPSLFGPAVDLSGDGPSARTTGPASAVVAWKTTAIAGTAPECRGQVAYFGRAASEAAAEEAGPADAKPAPEPGTATAPEPGTATAQMTRRRRGGDQAPERGVIRPGRSGEAYGKESDWLRSAKEQVAGTTHAVTLQNLTPGSVYRIRPICVNAAGLESGGPLIVLKVPPAAKP